MAGLPVEYIVETTAKCNLYCPMCPRETHPAAQSRHAGAVFKRLVGEAAQTAEHMMLIGLGEPLLDPHIYERIETATGTASRHCFPPTEPSSTRRAAARILDSPLDQITLSFDGATKESFEFFRKGAKFESVRDNFVRFARLKHERSSRLQVVVQMVRMEGNAGEVEEFLRFWRAVPGVDQVRIKEDETNLMRPRAGHAAEDWKYPCHYLWRGPLYVKHNGDVYPCCQSYMLDGAPLANIEEKPLEEIWNAEAMQDMRRLHAAGRGGEVDMCSRCCTTIPHPVLVAGSLVFHGKTVRRWLPWVERMVYLTRLPGKWLRPPKG